MHNRPFSRFLVIWSGQLISSIGSGLTAFSLGVYAFRLTQSATVYSMIILLAFLPSYLLKPFGGTLADRIDRRLLIIVGDLGSAMGLVLILVAMLIGIEQLWIIYTGVALSSLFVAIHNPAYKASVTDLVDEEMYGKASGLIQLAESSRFIISPVIAGFLINTLRIEHILLIDISTFVLAMLAVVAVKGRIGTSINAKEESRFLADFATGFKYVFSRNSLIRLLILTSVITFSIGFLQSLLGPMILSFATPAELGTTQTISALGMLVSSLLIGLFSKWENQMSVLARSLFLTGLFYTLMGISTNLLVITTSGFLFFATLPFVNTSLEVMIRKDVDNHMQGRAWSVVSLISQMGMVIAMGSAGLLADKVFNPMLQNNGILASSIGMLTGTGPGRGIGLMFILAGLLLAGFSFRFNRIDRLI